MNPANAYEVYSQIIGAKKMDDFMRQAHNAVVRAEADLDKARKQLDMAMEAKPKTQLPAHVGGVFQNEPRYRQRYYSFSQFGDIEELIWADDPLDKKAFILGNCYVCEEAAQWYVEQREVEIAALRAGVPHFVLSGYKAGNNMLPLHEVNLRDAVGEDRLKYLHPWTEDA